MQPQELRDRIQGFGTHGDGELTARRRCCPNGHDLKMWSAQSGRCDGCCRFVQQGEHVMDCRMCNFYLCPDCSKADEESLWGALSTIMEAARQDVMGMVVEVDSFVMGMAGQMSCQQTTTCMDDQDLEALGIRISLCDETLPWRSESIGMPLLQDVEGLQGMQSAEETKPLMDSSIRMRRATDGASAGEPSTQGVSSGTEAEAAKQPACDGAPICEAAKQPTCEGEEQKAAAPSDLADPGATDRVVSLDAKPRRQIVSLDAKPVDPPPPRIDAARLGA
mmetsp:Transcript_44803/g.115956  ORF Transcript_44803/g.115956 Transcript_44803/m.115956 type:complete len:278 (+) Transcript_44803:78-911(+)